MKFFNFFKNLVFFLVIVFVICLINLALLLINFLFYWKYYEYLGPTVFVYSALLIVAAIILVSPLCWFLYYRRRKKQGHHPSKYRWIGAIILSELFAFAISWLYLLIFAFTLVFGGPSSTFLTKDKFKNSDFKTVVGDRELVAIPFSFKKEFTTFYSPDGSIEIVYRLNPQTNFEEILMNRSGKRKEILKQISRASGYYTVLNWTKDGELLLFCFNQWSSGAPTNAKYEEMCFSYDIANEETIVLSDSQQHLIR